MKVRHSARVATGAVALVLASAAWTAARGDDRVEQGHKLFKDQGCPQCHGFGGKGDGYLLKMLKEPAAMHDWTDGKTLQAMDDTYLFEITKQGGEPLGKSKVMLPYGHKLSDDEIRAIIAYVRSIAKSAP
jgi:mono/diheme cytochrome c family protein